MKYRDARLLRAGDEVTLKSDGSILTVVRIEAFGQYKKVQIITNKGYYYNEDVK